MKNTFAPITFEDLVPGARFTLRGQDATVHPNGELIWDDTGEKVSARKALIPFWLNRPLPFEEAVIMMLTNPGRVLVRLGSAGAKYRWSKERRRFEVQHYGDTTWSKVAIGGEQHQLDGSYRVEEEEK